ncbi:transposase [Trichothermofontia sichuanensis B231]|uniref:hypothetical protein n=1 Tax=Trichothermofontia sichuanensis TaxID=3045816 RepID=UPI002247C705|nr:transposase [Trichothermofontia sichuanensis B231]
MSDAEWAVLVPLLSVPKGFGHPRTVDRDALIQFIFLANARNDFSVVISVLIGEAVAIIGEDF